MIDYLSHNIARFSKWKPSVPQRYIGFASLGGAVFAVLHFGEVIARKSLGASPLTVTLLTMCMPVGALTSIWWARLLVGRDQRKFLIIFGLIANLALLTGIFLNNMLHMIVIFMCFFIFNALMVTADNRILQQHIPARRTGRLFGSASAARLGIAALFAFGIGMYMDRVEGGFRHIFILVAVAGIASTFVMSSIRTGYVKGADPIPINKRLLLEPVQKLIQLLKRRKDYFRFEVAFMLYGIAFMMTLPVIPLYLVDDLQFSYSQIGLAKGTIAQLIMIFCVPMFGRIFDRTTPHKLASVVFFLLAFFPIILLSAGRVEGTMRMILVYTAFGYFGFVMSGVIVLWSLSSLRFAGKEDSGVYHSVHVAATGIRGSFAPLIGYYVMTTLGKTTALLTASVIWILSSILMILMRRWDIRVGEDRSLRPG